MNLKRTLRYHWLKFRRLQGDPKKLAWGMALGVFIGVTPTVPFHTILALTLAPLLGISPVTAYFGIWVMNPITIAPMYLAAYKVGKFCLHAAGTPLIMPDSYDFQALLQLLWKGGLALQVGGIIIALPPAIISYFLTLWIVQRYRQRKAQKAAGVSSLPPDNTAASRPKA
jgi:uncharacterized protein (DUF2062 family)